VVRSPKATLGLQFNTDERVKESVVGAPVAAANAKCAGTRATSAPGATSPTVACAIAADSTIGVSWLRRDICSGARISDDFVTVHCEFSSRARQQRGAVRNTQRKLYGRRSLQKVQDDIVAIQSAEIVKESVVGVACCTANAEVCVVTRGVGIRRVSSNKPHLVACRSLVLLIRAIRARAQITSVVFR